MAHFVYALLVGINDYPSPVPKLRGCVNDVARVETFLTTRLDPKTHTLKVLKLINQQATRQAIIDGFRQHLGRARANDVVLFYFAGHGAQEAVPFEMQHTEPDGRSETLVCYDSRTAHSRDLTDKELAHLIGEVADHTPHILVILDCCHSGSGTRHAANTYTVRSAPPDMRPRALSSLLFAQVTAQPDVPSGQRTRSLRQVEVTFKRGRHVLFSACHEQEEAHELTAEGEPRGAFSYYLLHALSNANSFPSYRDLFKRAEAAVRGRFTRQTPQLEATHSEDLNTPFLQLAAAARQPAFTMSFHREHGWIVDGGALHGIPQPTPDTPISFALFPIDAPDHLLNDMSRAVVGCAEVYARLPNLCKVRPCEPTSPEPDRALTFRAVLVNLPVQRLRLYLNGTSSYATVVRNILFSHRDVAWQAVEAADAADLRVISSSNEVRVLRGTDDRLMATFYHDRYYNPLRDFLNRAARWLQICDLHNPQPQRLSPNDVTISLLRLTAEGYAPQAQQPIWSSADTESPTHPQLSYTKTLNKQEPPRFEVEIANARCDDLALYVALLVLGEDYSIESLLSGGSVRLLPGQSVSVQLGAGVPDALWQAGITRTQDIFKVLVCTGDFDATLLTQSAEAVRATQKVGLQRALSAIARPSVMRSVFRLQAEPMDDWLTIDVPLLIERPAVA